MPSIFKKIRQYVFLAILVSFFVQPYSLITEGTKLKLEEAKVFAVHEPGHTEETDIVPPAPAVTAPVDTPTPAQATVIQNRNVDLGNECSLWVLQSWIPCFMTSIYNLSAQALSVVGQAFNIALAFTLDTGCSGEGANERCTVLASQQLENAWSNIKDLANIAFILGLIYISMSLITGWQSSQAKSTFIKIILIAIVINFSLFGTKVLIDAGNITAKMFYDQLVITDTGAGRTYDRGAANGLFFSDNVQIKDVSGAVMSKFNPTRIFSQTSFNSFVTSFNGKDQKWGIVLVLMFAFTIMNVVIGVSFVIASLTFISRTVWLVLLSIVSPLALVSTFLPIGKGLFDKWLTMLFDRCFCVVVYLFFIWLLIIVSESFVVADATTGISASNWQQVLLLVVVQFIAVYTIIKIATDQTKKMCEGGTGLGTFAAGSLNKLPGLVAGGILGGAVGAAGLAARSTVGGAAYNLSQGRGVFGGESNFLGKWLEQRAADGGPVSTFTRNRLRDIGDSKFGTNTGFADKQEAGAKRWQKTQQTMENLRNRTKLNEAEDRFVNNKGNDAGISKDHDWILDKYRAEQQRKGKTAEEIAADIQANKEKILRSGYSQTTRAGDDQKAVYAETAAKVTEMQVKQSKGIGGAMDFIINRGVATAGEAARRREDQIQTDRDTEITKKSKERQASEEKAKIAIEMGKIGRQASRSTAEVTQQFDRDWTENDPVVKGQIQLIADQSQELLSGLSETVKEEYKKLVTETFDSVAAAKADFEKFKQDAIRRREEAIRPHKEREEQANERLRNITDPDRDFSAYERHSEMLADIENEIKLERIEQVAQEDGSVKEVRRSGAARITPERKQVLASYGINVDEGSELGGDNLSRLSDVKQKIKTDRDAAQKVYETEAARVKTEREKEIAEIKDAQAKIKKEAEEHDKRIEAVRKESVAEVKGIMKGYEATLKQRGATLVEEKQARLAADQIQSNAVGNVTEADALNRPEDVMSQTRNTN